MQLYCSPSPKNIVWSFLISVVEAITAIEILTMQKKLKVPHCLQSRLSHRAVPWREEKDWAQQDPVSGKDWGAMA